MYQVNGIDLTGSEYNELYLLVTAYKRGEDLDEFTDGRLGKFPDLDQEKRIIYNELAKVKLISGINTSTGFIFSRLNQSGVDFIDDYKALKDTNDMESKTSRNHDYKVALVGAVTGAIFGFLGGVLGAWISFTQGWF